LACRHIVADCPTGVSLGLIQQPTVYRKSITDIVPASAPLFWNLRKG
jgi:hypothetical protein